eukprot:c19715_g1_i1.p1 GENE.c19715_g1_i1~~c19715_g1_i1.p1  ORF type:complete len:238 (-),score=31.73 c19715_g1_i1:32-745(-)
MGAETSPSSFPFSSLLGSRWPATSLQTTSQCFSLPPNTKNKLREFSHVMMWVLALLVSGSLFVSAAPRSNVDHTSRTIVRRIDSPQHNNFHANSPRVAFAPSSFGLDLLEIGEGLGQDQNSTDSAKPQGTLVTPAVLSQEQKEYNEDPWSVYGGETSLFCRIQYYHDTVEMSPQCKLAEYETVPREYHLKRFNCQFFEQRGIVYLYGELWHDCTPLSQRGKKLVMECGQQCAPRASV